MRAGLWWEVSGQGERSLRLSALCYHPAAALQSSATTALPHTDAGEAYKNLGSCYGETGRLPEAATAYAGALRINPQERRPAPCPALVIV